MSLFTFRLACKRKLLRALVVIVSTLLCSGVSRKDTNDLIIYLSADRTGSKASGLSIEQGIRTALAEVDYKMAGRNVELKILDHRGSTPRAKRHLDMFLKDPNALTVFSGLHSPPLLTYRDFINSNQILLLDPWAAAAPITRGVSEENWIFRLSIDDSKAGEFITDYAVNKRKMKKPALLLEQTGWGLSNQKNMSQALDRRGIKPAKVTLFNWGMSEKSARIIIRDLHQAGADSIFLVANYKEGIVVAKAMASLSPELRLPIFSHWGITGGSFENEVSYETRSKIELNFIQTSFSFTDPLSPFQKKVFESSKKQYPKVIKTVDDIKAPTGFIHAYDLTKILISASKKLTENGDIETMRSTLRLSLESLEQPVQGLIKKYTKPFTRYRINTPDAHEALNALDFRMAQYGSNGEILLNKD